MKHDIVKYIPHLCGAPHIAVADTQGLDQIANVSIIPGKHFTYYLCAQVMCLFLSMGIYTSTILIMIHNRCNPNVYMNEEKIVSYQVCE